VGVVTHNRAHPTIGRADPHADLVVTAIQNHPVAVLRRRVIQVLPGVRVGHHHPRTQWKSTQSRVTRSRYSLPMAPGLYTVVPSNDQEGRRPASGGWAA